MATRLKTVEYWFPELAAVTDNTDTNFTQITVYLPETGTKTFRSVILDVIIQDAEATSNNVNTRQVSLRLGAAAYTVITNSNLMTTGGEQKWLNFVANFTTHFTTNWTGTSMTCDARVLFDSAIATPAQAWRGATARLSITYEYDDTSTTHVKTVKIPLDTYVAALGTTKPGTATATIPALDTFCPEASKTFRQIALVVQGNEESAATTDKTMSWEVDTAGVYTTSSHESALNTSCFFRHSQIQSFTTSATHSWYLWASLAVFSHVQAWIVVTYEFNSSTSTSILNSLLLPFTFEGGAGHTTNTEYQRAFVELWIEEPTTITIAQSAAFYFWEQNTGTTGIQHRINAGSWSGALTSTAATVSGSCVSMDRCESDITLARGYNKITTDMYKTGTISNPSGLTGYFMLNYTSGKATDGVGAHNKTIEWNLLSYGTLNFGAEFTASAVSVTIPETNYFITSLGAWLVQITNSTNVGTGDILLAERLSGEGDVGWIPMCSEVIGADNQPGIKYRYPKADKVFKMFTGDARAGRLDVESSRKYRHLVPGASYQSAFSMLFTYHTITRTISGTISGSNGGTVTLNLHRTSTKEFLMSTTRSGNGTYSFTWYDNTEDMYVVAYEDDTHTGRSANDPAT